MTCRANREAPDKAQREWLDSLPARLRSGLAKLGLVDSRSAAGSKALDNHVADFESALEAKGASKRHWQPVIAMVRRVTAGCGFQFWQDVSATAVEQCLASMRDEKGRSIQTCNHHLQAIKQFARWMVANGRAGLVAPRASPSAEDVATDRQHVRRAAISRGTEPGCCRRHSTRLKQFGMSGGERAAALHRLAAETGLRAGELRSLTRASFAAGKRIRRRCASRPAIPSIGEPTLLPLRHGTAAELRGFLASKFSAAPAFSKMPGPDKTARLVRRDLALARKLWIEEMKTPAERAERERSDFLFYRDHSGRVKAKLPFNCARKARSSRGTCRDQALANGRHPLARHCDPSLTANVYTHVTLGEQSKAIEWLPDLSEPFRQPMQATGTDDRDEAPARLALCLAQKRSESLNSVQSDAVEPRGAANCAIGVNAEKNAENAANSSGWAGIRTLDGVTPISVFKTDALDHSATHPDLREQAHFAHKASQNEPVPGD